MYRLKDLPINGQTKWPADRLTNRGTNQLKDQLTKVRPTNISTVCINQSMDRLTDQQAKEVTKGAKGLMN